MTQRHTSFLSEHTVEFIVVPRIVEILETRFRNVIPLYFWSSREGTARHDKEFCEAYFRLVTCYPRRPKVNVLDRNRILVKFNREVLEAASTIRSFGVPVLAGVPIVSGLLQVSMHCECVFFDLGMAGTTSEDKYTWIDDRSMSVVWEDEHIGIAGPLDHGEIIDLVTKSNVIEGGQALDVIRRARLELAKHRQQQWFPFPVGYKPFHLLLPE